MEIRNTVKLFLANESLVLVDCASVIAWAAYRYHLDDLTVHILLGVSRRGRSVEPEPMEPSSDG